MHKYVLIMAGGSGQRMGGDTPKQFLLLQGKPILMHTINRFLEYDKNIDLIVVLPESQIGEWENICEKYNYRVRHTVTNGGDERFYSVKNGLKMTRPDSLIAIHDGVRPLVSESTISRCFEVAGKKGNAIPVISTPESVRESNGHDQENRPLNRDSIKLVQTPQVFKSDLLHKAYDCGFSPHYTDDATVVERLGIKINLVEGNRGNIKITTPGDILIAETLIKKFILK